MKTRILALALALILLLTACATAPAETTAPATTAPAETTQPVETTAAPPETTAPPAALIRYPLEVDAAYADLAQELPAHIYTTKGSENGLAGTIYTFEGTVADYSTTEIEGTGVEQVFVETDGGTVMVANFYKWLYNSARNAYGKAAADSAYPYPLGGYRLPGIGETAEFVAIYIGYSETAGAPAFYLGANPALYKAIDCQDPTQEPLGTKDNPYMPGMYKVGSDLPAGEYCFVATGGGGYACISKDSNQGDIIENEFFEHTWFATVSDGQYLEASRCAFVVAADVVLNIEPDGSFEEGMYRVGIDIPAGEYKLTADDDGYYCVYKNSVPPFDIVANNFFDGSSYVTVKDGQYLMTSGCIAVPVR